MTYSTLYVGLLAGACFVAGPAMTGCVPAQADDDSLRDSFAERLAGTSLVADFIRTGDELTFRGPDGAGGTAEWRVRIDTTLVEPSELDAAMPFEERLTAEWSVNGELVEWLGNMTALPGEYLDRGLAQECWAYWVEAERRWSW